TPTATRFRCSRAAWWASPSSSCSASPRRSWWRAVRPSSAPFSQRCARASSTSWSPTSRRRASPSRTRDAGGPRPAIVLDVTIFDGAWRDELVRLGGAIPQDDRAAAGPEEESLAHARVERYLALFHSVAAAP